MDDMQEALRWALHTLRAELAKTCKPDDPIWNDWHRANRICEGLDPDGD